MTVEKTYFVAQLDIKDVPRLVRTRSTQVSRVYRDSDGSSIPTDASLRDEGRPNSVDVRAQAVLDASRDNRVGRWGRRRNHQLFLAGELPRAYGETIPSIQDGLGYTSVAATSHKLSGTDRWLSTLHNTAPKKASDPTAVAATIGLMATRLGAHETIMLRSDPELSRAAAETVASLMRQSPDMRHDQDQFLWLLGSHLNHETTRLHPNLLPGVDAQVNLVQIHPTYEYRTK